MATQTRLDQDLERQVALVYLAGIGTRYITDRFWGVSDSTIRHNIVGRRSHEWNDPLVEFYRQTNSRDRLRNAVHLYLTFNGQSEDFPNAHLIDKERDKAVYEAVDENIFAPRTKKLIEETNLERRLRTPKPVSPDERMLVLIFGKPNIYQKALKIVNPLLYQKLREIYMQDGKINIKDVYAQVANEVYQILKRGLYLAPKTIPSQGILKAILDKQLNTVLQALTPRERRVLQLRFGLEEGLPKTLEEIGQEFALTRQRIEQIEAKALRKLRHPSRSRKLRQFLES